MDIIQLQKIIFDYFKDVEDATLVEIVDSFVYDQPNPSSEVSKIIEKFMKDNGLETAFINYHYDKEKKNKFFDRSQLSEKSMIENVKMSLLGLSHNRFRASLNTSKDTSKNKTNFNYLKRELLDCYESLNRNENYFFGEKADAEIVKRITKLEYKN